MAYAVYCGDNKHVVAFAFFLFLFSFHSFLQHGTFFRILFIYFVWVRSLYLPFRHIVHLNRQQPPSGDFNFWISREKHFSLFAFVIVFIRAQSNGDWNGRGDDMHTIEIQTLFVSNIRPIHCSSHRASQYWHHSTTSVFELVATFHRDPWECRFAMCVRSAITIVTWVEIFMFFVIPHWIVVD